MGRQTWASNPQTTWLTQCKKNFLEAQAKGTTRAFVNATTEAFIETWPMDVPTPAELLDADGDVESAKKNKLDRRREQIEWWFRNHVRPTATGKSNKGASATLSLTWKKSQLIAPYQSYLYLYSKKVMVEVPVAYANYITTKKPDDPDRHSMSFVQEVAKSLLNAESESVKEEVEAYRQKHYTEQLVTPITFEALLTEGVEEAQKNVQALQKSINMLARMGLEALKAVEDQTGFKGTLFLGGPNPETGQNVTLAIHNRTTLHLGNIWPEASEDWKMVQSSFDLFILRAFPPELPKQLESLFNGETTDGEPSAGASGSTTAIVQAGGALPASNDGLSQSQPSADKQDSVGHLNAEQAHSPTPSQHTESCTSANPTVMEPKQPKPRPRQPMPEPSYDDICRARHAQNLRVWNVMAKQKVDADEARRIVEAGEDLNLPVEEPEWAVEAREHLEEVSDEGWWRDLVKAWGQFEAALGYPDGGNHANRISAKSRPEEARNWINRARNYNRPPKIRSLVIYVKTWKGWWHDIQPRCRQGDDDVRWPPQRVTPSDSSEWAKVRRGGCNGLFMVVLCLGWWFKALQEVGSDVGELREAVEDVIWVLGNITPTAEGASPAHMSPSPDASPSFAASALRTAPASLATTVEPTPALDTALASTITAEPAPAANTAPVSSSPACASPITAMSAGASAPSAINSPAAAVPPPSSLPTTISPPSVTLPVSTVVTAPAQQPMVVEGTSLPPSNNASDALPLAARNPARDPVPALAQPSAASTFNTVDGLDSAATMPATNSRPPSDSLVPYGVEGRTSEKRPAAETDDAPATKKAKDSENEHEST